ncbi:MFS transporter [Pendulispora albinea]|uniref:MFS transporter n=1 Tax=Pendulispora albinea TaxID=2741071 RepID=A0ABZ2MAB2_9BACT
MVDRSILYATAFLRALATGMVAVVLAAHLASLGFRVENVGYVVAAGLAGNAAALLGVTILAGRVDRKVALIVLGVSWTAGALVTAVASSAVIITAAAFLGMLNGAGRDRGGALALEQAALPATTTDSQRTRTFAWYNVLQDVGHALGALLGGLPALLERASALSPMDAYRVTLGVYVACAVLSLALYTRLSSLRAGGTEKAAALSPQTRRVLVRISALFALDSLGGGFLTTALLSYFFFERFGASQAIVAVLFFAARVANALSHVGAAMLARRIGLVNTMVLTHLPSSFLLLTVAIAPSFPVAAALFLVREGLVEMDVPTRQSYVMALVRPEERAVASGMTNLVRMAGWAVAPLVAGVLMQRSSLTAPLVAGALMKIGYDVLLYRGFRSVRPPEEASTSA